LGEDDLDDDQLQESPLFTADHRPCGVAVFPVSVEPTVGRGNAVGAGRCRIVRNDPAMRLQIRGGLRQAVAQKEAVAKGYLAFGRGPDFHRWPKTLALARG